jgi:hypothetical protein
MGTVRWRGLLCRYVVSLQHAWRNFLSRSLANFLLDGVVDSPCAITGRDVIFPTESVSFQRFNRRPTLPIPDKLVITASH